MQEIRNPDAKRKTLTVHHRSCFQNVMSRVQFFPINEYNNNSLTDLTINKSSKSLIQ